MTGFGAVLYPTLPTCRKTSLHSEAIESEGGGLTWDQEESRSPAPPVVSHLLPAPRRQEEPHTGPAVGVSAEAAREPELPSAQSPSLAIGTAPDGCGGRCPWEHLLQAAPLLSPGE